MLTARLPEAEALEEHADPLPAFRDPVQAAVEVEVLERSQLSVEQRLVPEEPDLRAVDRHFELARGWNDEPGEQPEQRRLPGSVRAGDEQQLPSPDVDVDVRKDALVSEPPSEPVSVDHLREAPMYL